MFDIRMLNFKMIRMSNVKMFDVQHSTDKCQNDLNVRLFDVCIQMSNVKLFDVCIQMSNAKLFDVRHSNAFVECQMTNIKPTSVP